MSKSRGNFLDPNDFVAAFGADGARYVVLREVPFDRDAEVSWDSFVRRYNADLANDLGNLVNRTVSMAGRYLDGERPPPRATAASSLGTAWSETLQTYRTRIEASLLHDALATLWDFVGQANKAVDAEQPWVLAKAAKAGDAASGERLRDVLGDLIEACRLVGLAAAPFMPSTAPRLLAQLGHAYPYGPAGSDGPPVLDELEWADPCRGLRTPHRTRTALPAPRHRDGRALTIAPRLRLRCARAPDRQPLPPQRRPVRIGCRPGHRGRSAGWGGTGPGPRLEPRLIRASPGVCRAVRLA